MSHPLTVTQLTKQIKSLLERNLGEVLLQGEISGLARPSSGHLYFTVKDNHAQISAAMFRFAARSLQFNLENGLEVLLHGKLSVYEPRGSYQLLVERIEPLGAGALQLAFEQLKNRLAEEGLFDMDKKKPTPLIPQRIGVVTSATGAALQDILNVLGRRFPSIPVVINPVLVQGREAAQQIAQAIRQFSSEPNLSDVDVLIVGRGGGSLEDLWCFNEEIVVRAIYECPIPIISAVGHEVDYTITDFVADLRAPTPSAAAELAVPNQSDLLERLQGIELYLQQQIQNYLGLYQQRLDHAQRQLHSPEKVIQAYTQKVEDLKHHLKKTLQQMLLQSKHDLERKTQNLFFLSPQKNILEKKQKIERAQEKIQQTFLHMMEKKRLQLEEQSHLLQSLSPLTVLSRGYATATDSKGNVKTKVEDFEENTDFQLHLSDGKIEATVKKRE